MFCVAEWLAALWWALGIKNGSSEGGSHAMSSKS